MENAILHGIARRKDGGEILLTAHVSGKRLIITLRNENSDASSGRAGAGIGLANVRQRLEVLYGAEQSLDLASEPQGRTTAKLSLPFSPGEAQESASRSVH